MTADLQSVKGDLHLRLIYQADPLPEREHGDDEAEYSAMAAWADRTCGGVARVECLAGNVGYLDLKPILFPVVLCGDVIAAAMSVVASTDALIIDVRHCLGGDPNMVAFLCSYLCGREPVELSRLYERGEEHQSWTLPFVPGRRFGAAKPVYVLTSAATFSGGEQLAYDLQQITRATVVGERTKGGANAREGFRLTDHLEATISVARAVSPRTGGNWEGTGVAPDIAVSAERARDRAYRLALERVAASGGAAALVDGSSGPIDSIG